MADTRQVIQALFETNNISITKARLSFFEAFLENAGNNKKIHALLEIQDELMQQWKHDNRVADIIEQPVRILNATVGKPYEARLDFDKLNWKDISSFLFEGLDEPGLTYDEKTRQLTGVPLRSGEFNIIMRFKLTGENEEAGYHERKIPLIVNPDPRSLWKNLESDRNDPYWKEDNITLFSTINDRHILVSSKRGRSHANAGSFREDDFAFQEFASGWCLVAVADGAGSARLSRKGSAIACNAVVEYFTEDSANGEGMSAFDDLLQQHKTAVNNETQKRLNHYVYNKLGKAAFFVHKKLEEFAAGSAVTLKDLNTTLIFTLFKKYDIGYAFLSFGVGDCPIAVVNRDESEVTLMNWLDVGEFGGGTRFITMPEIFKNEKFATRFGFKLVDDFAFLMMTDGIYDAKFVVEANLPKMEKWKEFLADLGGKNEEGIRVELNTDNKEIVQQFSSWMDFWSQGNHDDRTLAIVF